ncbi:hypothetical protein [Microbispora triticiradicis]|uniref:hypothetical protein n=1 Tax=Microbispora triticiradicis TaxID=2200763 RepID=UPI001AD61E55|nr:hypothetical protein [Microbispora triticiradicis]MBO4274829.1 hypothetical protein [Microbispora triticiradicis]
MTEEHRRSSDAIGSPTLEGKSEPHRSIVRFVFALAAAIGAAIVALVVIYATTREWGAIWGWVTIGSILLVGVAFKLWGRENPETLAVIIDPANQGERRRLIAMRAAAFAFRAVIVVAVVLYAVSVLHSREMGQVAATLAGVVLVGVSAYGGASAWYARRD